MENNLTHKELNTLEHCIATAIQYQKELLKDLTEDKKISKDEMESYKGLINQFNRQIKESEDLRAKLIEIQYNKDIEEIILT